MNAQAEVGKPFPQEEELKVKSARLAERDSLLNMDEGLTSLAACQRFYDRPVMISERIAFMKEVYLFFSEERQAM